MDIFKQLCRDMAKNPHVMTFSDIGCAITKGAVVGQKSGIAGGALIGATVELSREATKRVIIMVTEIIDEQQVQPTFKSKKTMH